MKKNKKEARVVWEIVVAVATLVVTIIGIAITTVQTRYGMNGVDSAYQWTSKFQKDQSTNVIATTKHWTKGDVYYGVNQKKGTVKTKSSIPFLWASRETYLSTFPLQKPANSSFVSVDLR